MNDTFLLWNTQLIPLNRVMFEKPTVAQLNKKFPHFMNPLNHYYVHKCKSLTLRCTLISPCY